MGLTKRLIFQPLFFILFLVNATQIFKSSPKLNIGTINISEKLDQIDDYWHPRLVAELNGQHVRLAKLKGEFVWHQHDSEDEMFLVIRGHLKIALRDKTIVIGEGEFVVIPRGVEHKPIAEVEVHVMLFEPAETLNTGDKVNDLTRKTNDWI
jgi:mannose-6-phosphate isomerase-like protein (cupin superfamily)